MEKLQNAINIFALENGQYLLDNIKQIYRKLASTNHPDKGGDTETMQLINTAFAEFCKYFETNTTLDINQDDSQGVNFWFMQQLKAMQGVVIEVCGYWVWVTGNTYIYKGELHVLGFKYSSAKKAWYWSPTITVSNYRRGSKSLKKIRRDYGSQKIEGEEPRFLS